MTAPQAMTYDSLVSDIQLYTERSDSEFVSQIDRFIMLGEQRLALEAKGLGFQRVVAGKMVANNPVLEKPSNWRQTKSLFYTDSNGKTKYLFSRKYEYCRMYSNESIPGDPEYYADYDFDHFFLACTPSQAFDFELTYYERPTPLSKANQTNWTTRYAPHLLLYACLLEAQPFLKNQAMLTLWQSQYSEIIGSLGKENAMYDHDATEATK